jgi:hypothetical protein
MPIEVDSSEAPEFIRCTVTGAWPGIEAVRDFRERLIADGLLTAATCCLFDIRDVETVPSYTEVAPMIEAAKKAGGLPLRRAYVVGSAEQFGIVRQMKALAPAGIQVEIFFNDAEALLWLHRTSEPAPPGGDRER